MLLDMSTSEAETIIFIFIHPVPCTMYAWHEALRICFHGCKGWLTIKTCRWSQGLRGFLSLEVVYQQCFSFMVRADEEREAAVIY